MAGQVTSVSSDEYDGRNFTHEDNSENLGAYVGVDPMYQNYANEGEKPYPFSREEQVAAAEKGGLEVEEEGDGEEEDGDPESFPTPVSTSPESTPPVVVPPVVPVQPSN